MCKFEVRCPKPCNGSRRGKLLLKVAPDTEGEIETVCHQKYKCIVTYDATSGKIKCDPQIKS